MTVSPVYARPYWQEETGESERPSPWRTLTVAVWTDGQSIFILKSGRRHSKKAEPLPNFMLSEKDIRMRCCRGII